MVGTMAWHNQVVLDGSHRAAPQGGKYVSRASPHELVEVAISVRRANPLPPQTPRLSLEELTASYGAGERDIALVEEVLGGLGLAHVSSSRATRIVRFRGSIERLEEVFAVDLKVFKAKGRRFRARTGVIHLPKTLENIVEDVVGLDARPIGRHRRLAKLAPARSRRRGGLQRSRTPSLPATTIRRVTGRASGSASLNSPAHS